jgi:hypothetical protein
MILAYTITSNRNFLEKNSKKIQLWRQKAVFPANILLEREIKRVQTGGIKNDYHRIKLDNLFRMQFRWRYHQNFLLKAQVLLW